MKTRDKIVYASLKLFNESGERNITTNHIASDLSISPGNLYYHFKNKQEIIRDIFDGYSEELLSLFSAIDEPNESLALFKRYLDAIFTLMWKYRFFYANLSQILQQDPLLHQRYLAVQEKLKRNLQLSFNELIKIELIEIEEDDLQTVITSLHLIILSWLSYQAAVSLKTKITEQVIYQGMLQMTAVLKPFTTHLGRQQLLALEEEIAKKC